MRKAFTLIEVMTALAIAMVLAGICTTALLQIRTMVKRAQMRIAMHQRAETVFLHLHNQMAAVQQSGALVVDADSAGPRVRLLAMVSKQDNWDWSWPREGGNESKEINRDTSDMRWWLLEWNGDQADQRLYAANSSPVRRFRPTVTLRNPALTTINFNGRNFVNLPQPRRSLGSPADWRAATAALDDNQLFPDLTAAATYPDQPRPSLAGVDDLGDWGDLVAQRGPIASGVTDFRIELVAGDGVVRGFDRSASAFRAHDGVWLDGSLGSVAGVHSGSSATALAGPIGQRPRLMRVLLTLEERLRPRDPAVPDSDATRLQQTFTFSFLLPGANGPPSGP
jgi:hypothetical protein